MSQENNVREIEDKVNQVKVTLEAISLLLTDSVQAMDELVPLVDTVINDYNKKEDASAREQISKREEQIEKAKVEEKVEPEKEEEKVEDNSTYFYDRLMNSKYTDEEFRAFLVEAKAPIGMRKKSLTREELLKNICELNIKVPFLDEVQGISEEEAIQQAEPEKTFEEEVEDLYESLSDNEQYLCSLLLEASIAEWTLGYCNEVAEMWGTKYNTKLELLIYMLDVQTQQGCSETDGWTIKSLKENLP